MTDYTIVRYNPYVNNEIDHEEARYLYGSVDGNYPEWKLVKELDKYEAESHSRESKRNGLLEHVEVKKVLIYKEKLSEEELKGYKLILLAKIYEPILVR